MQANTSASFSSADAAAVESIAQKKSDLARAKKLSPSLVSHLQTEIEASEAALSRARDLGREYDAESAALARAEAAARAAAAELGSSLDVEPDAIATLLSTHQVAVQVAGARRRRSDAARDGATSAYHRAAKQNPMRDAAINYAEHLAAACADNDLARVKPESRAPVVAWLRIVLPNEGQAYFSRAVAANALSPSRTLRTLEPADYAQACAAFFSEIESLRERAARQAADLGAAVGA